MNAITLVILGCTVTMVKAQGYCWNKKVEREEIKDDLEAMWSVRPQLNCSTENIDAATMTPDKKTYFFKGEYYWRLIDAKVAPGYPRLITQDWDGLPGNLDAALTWSDGRTFFFKGSIYWSFHNKNMDDNYPRNISEGFCGIPDNIDGALLWKPNNVAYFFKGNQYWRFDGGDSCIPVDVKSYPMSINEWPNIPANIDDALQWENGRSYFIKNGYYYRYNDDGKDREAGRPVNMHTTWGVKCVELKCRIPPLTDIKKDEDETDNILKPEIINRK